jgi:undecaprenyl-diphosphatase
LFFWAVLVSYSRIYSGVHYPLDILGGAVLGWFLAVVFYKLLMFLENHFFIARTPKIGKTKITQAQTGTVFLVFGILSLTVIITTYILHYYNYL